MIMIYFQTYWINSLFLQKKSGGKNSSKEKDVWEINHQQPLCRRWPLHYTVSTSIYKFKFNFLKHKEIRSVSFHIETKKLLKTRVKTLTSWIYLFYHIYYIFSIYYVGLWLYIINRVYTFLRLPKLHISKLNILCFCVLYMHIS